ncbi:efflux RND transporter periplasmic adaptor subunit [Oceanicella actignis]|uniref:efflux RND transporter periplasmic adaptor subunit n=1 Tax=Oceanicella actignis TaxID=1189325 RepID=UPI0011E86266|nr:efflux RND transporter periplasmic adaptor subunit [Oceanicella actignis]TYO91171.1 RND family efflux transporter MFP subunit [Oceanicella actignis]
MTSDRRRRAAPGAVLALIAASCILAAPARGAETVSEPAAGPAAEAPIRVEVVRAQPRPVRRVLALTGEIAPRDSLDVAFPMGGRVLSVSRDKGERVRAGEELARLDAIQQEQALRAAQAALEAAEADHRRAQTEFRRQEALLERGASTRVRRDEARRAYFVARAGLERARAELDRARKALSDAVLRAPADGLVIERLIEPGEVVGAARPVMTLALGDAIDAVFQAPETAPTGVPEALEVTLHPLSDPSIRHAGKVRRISPLVDPRTGTVEVKVAVEPPHQGLGFGDPVRAIVSQTLPERISLPASALSALGRSAAVWVADPASGRVAIRPVALSGFADGRIILESGVEPGELVVVAGAQLLYPGRRVVLSEVTE